MKQKLTPLEFDFPPLVYKPSYIEHTV